jgi:hypothetical protein
MNAEQIELEILRCEQRLHWLDVDARARVAEDAGVAALVSKRLEGLRAELADLQGEKP